MDTAWLKQIMRARKLTQEDLAAPLGRERSALSRYITGRTPLALHQIEPLAELLDVSVTELIIRAWNWSRASLLQLRAMSIARALDDDDLKLWNAVGERMIQASKSRAAPAIPLSPPTSSRSRRSG